MIDATRAKLSCVAATVNWARAAAKATNVPVAMSAFNSPATTANRIIDSTSGVPAIVVASAQYTSWLR